MKKLLFFFLSVALPAMASPQTSDADQKAVQMNIKVNADGTLTGYVGSVMLNGTTQITPQNSYLVNSAAIIHGNVTQVIGANFGPNPPFDSASSGTLVDCKGDVGISLNPYDRMGTGNSALLNEGPKLHSSGVVTSGDNGEPDAYRFRATGGDASVVLDSTKTSWPNFILTCGDSGGYLGSNVSLSLSSTQTSATLNITVNGSWPNPSGGSNSSISVAGSLLSVINLTLAVGVNNWQITNVDFSGSVANQASVDGIAVQFAAAAAAMAGYSGGAAYGTLNCAGGCASPSGTGAGDFATAASYGMTVYTN